MVMKLERVVPFGRSLDEYVKMFSINEIDADKQIVGIGDGPASFNAEMTALHRSVVSIDPLYVFSASQIENQFDAVVDDIISQVKATPNDWTWSYHQSPERLKHNRVRVLHRFLNDYETGKMQGRYVIGELPMLPIRDNTFQLALCSHLLFLYSDKLSYSFHIDSVREMLRVANEVRIFPLLTLMLKPSPYVSRLIVELETEGFCANVETVAYELQRGGNEMLRISRLLRNHPTKPRR